MNKNKNKLSLRMIKYELRCIAGNPFIHIFGVFFPIFLSILITKTVAGDISDPVIASETVNSIFLGISFIIPMATILMGYSATYSQEIEKGIPQRMRLFGFSDKNTIINRLFAELIYLTVAIVLYFGIDRIFIDYAVPTASGVIKYIVMMYIMAAILFILAHALSSLIKKFGPTYAITMILYFAMMIFGGLMGVSYDRMSKPMQAIARMFPFHYISEDMLTIWTGHSYNYTQMLQSYIFIAAVSGILLFIAIYKDSRKRH